MQQAARAGTGEIGACGNFGQGQLPGIRAECLNHLQPAGEGLDELALAPRML